MLPLSVSYNRLYNHLNHIVGLVRRFKMIMNTFLDENQRMMEKFTKYHLIDYEDEDVYDFMDIPRLHKKDLKKHRERYNDDIDDFIHNFKKRPLSSIDHNIIYQLLPDPREKRPELKFLSCSTHFNPNRTPSKLVPNKISPSIYRTNPSSPHFKAKSLKVYKINLEEESK